MGAISIFVVRLAWNELVTPCRLCHSLRLSWLIQRVNLCVNYHHWVIRSCSFLYIYLFIFVRTISYTCGHLYFSVHWLVTELLPFGCLQLFVVTDQNNVMYMSAFDSWMDFVACSNPINQTKHVRPFKNWLWKQGTKHVSPFKNLFGRFCVHL